LIVIVNSIALIFLIICAINDILTKQIPLGVLIAFGIMAFILAALDGALSSWSGGIRLLPGFMLLLIGFLTRQSIGYGDGMVVLIMGMLLGVHQCLIILFIGVILSSLVSIFILILKKGNYRTKLPFVPFLLVAWGVSWIVH
jgi:leader peptidase (prepilin peptidase)/N-methyltransferase